MAQFVTKYGYFNDSGTEYVITRPDTPRPWVNVICPGDYGVVVSQTGGGYSWRTHASLNRITRWNQDLIKDDWGKFFFIRDLQSKAIWSLTWNPTCPDFDSYQVYHGIGYSKFVAKYQGISSTTTLFVPRKEPLEIWRVELRNDSEHEKDLAIFSYFEWSLGAAPDWHREFHKVFIETEFDSELNTLWAGKRLWELSNAKGQHWNREWEYLAFHSINEKADGFESDKESFLGNYGSICSPAAVKEGKLSGTTGKWLDAIGSLQKNVSLMPGQSKTLIFLIGAVHQNKREEAVRLVEKYRQAEAVEESLLQIQEFWRQMLTTTEVQTPDPGFDLMSNIWFKYQALSSRIWGRTGYYQTGGAIGFRDQLQDSQIFLTIDPERTARQIKLHAAHQFPEGRVNHWWHPISESGIENKISDNLLWLPFVTVKYLKETANWDLLTETVPYKNGVQGSVYEHCCRAIDYSLSKRSPRGLPLIGDGDWNDGLNAVGFEGKGESIWLGEFLVGILKDFAVVAQKMADLPRSELYLSEAADLTGKINEYGWDGEWYSRATCDNGKIIGSQTCSEGKIFLNPQSWAILNEIAPVDRVPKVFEAMNRYLFKDYGPLLLYPAYRHPDPDIGYLTRYAPGLRENGGLYTHAGTWAVLTACKLGLTDQAYRLFKSFLPPHRGLDPDLYKVEPYVTPGNVDGPDSPNFGRGGWTWYTGSAAWSYLAALEGILGVRADWEGLRIEPVAPKEWDRFFLRRPFRGGIYEIHFQREGSATKPMGIYSDGSLIRGNLLVPEAQKEKYRIEVIF
ncbi:MAG: GH36-type glycosyl hydrolase domain-containing protein [Bacteroidota bacterium]